MKRASIVLALAGLVVPGPALGADAPESMTRYRCYICHADRHALAGPAFEDVAVAWRGQSRQEARAMARYILSLDPAPPGRMVRQPGEPAPKQP